MTTTPMVFELKAGEVGVLVSHFGVAIGSRSPLVTAPTTPDSRPFEQILGSNPAKFVEDAIKTCALPESVIQVRRAFKARGFSNTYVCEAENRIYLWLPEEDGSGIVMGPYDAPGLASWLLLPFVDTPIHAIPIRMLPPFGPTSLETVAALADNQRRQYPADDPDWVPTGEATFSSSDVWNSALPGIGGGEQASLVGAFRWLFDATLTEEEVLPYLCVLANEQLLEMDDDDSFRLGDGFAWLLRCLAYWHSVTLVQPFPADSACAPFLAVQATGAWSAEFADGRYALRMRSGEALKWELESRTRNWLELPALSQPKPEEPEPVMPAIVEEPVIVIEPLVEAIEPPQIAPEVVDPPVQAPPPATGSTCVKCGVALKPGAKFCPGCGAVVQAPPSKKFCRSCGAELDSDSRFCRGCGTPYSS